MLILWFAAGTNYPGRGSVVRRKRWFANALREVQTAMPPSMRMLIEYKPFEPAFSDSSNMATNPPRSSCLNFFAACVLLALFCKPACALDGVEQDPKFIALADAYRADFGGSVKAWGTNSAAAAAGYQVTPLATEHLSNATQMFIWIEDELKRYPAGFIKKYGPKNVVLSNAYITGSAKGSATPYSPTFISEPSSSSLLVTVPTTLTPSIEVLGRISLHQTIFNYLLNGIDSTDAPIAIKHWKTIETANAKSAAEARPWVFQQSNQRDGLYKMLWDPFECVALDANAKTDVLLKQRIEVVQSFMYALDPQFDGAFWATIATIPESQRTVCRNDLTDVHCADRIAADTEIQNDLQVIQDKWQLKVICTPGSPAPPMPAKVRLEYSYMTDKKLPQFKQFVHLVREELCSYPDEIVSQMNVESIYIMDDFIFRGAKVAGQAFTWLPKVAFGYGLSSFDPSSESSSEFFKRTIHHELFHLMDKRFSVDGGPICEANWTSMNEGSFGYRLGQQPVVDQPTFYKDNSTRRGFAERYGMNVATEDRASIYGRIMTEDPLFMKQLETDAILNAKTEAIFAFFDGIKKDLNIKSSNAFYTKLETIKTKVRSIIKRRAADPDTGGGAGGK